MVGTKFLRLFRRRLPEPSVFLNFEELKEIRRVELERQRAQVVRLQAQLGKPTGLKLKPITGQHLGVVLGLKPGEFWGRGG